MDCIDCDICGSKNIPRSKYGSYDCSSCLSFFTKSNTNDPILVGINFVKNFDNNNYIAIYTENSKPYIYYNKNYRITTFDIDKYYGYEATNKEKYDYLKSFMENIIFI